MNIGKDSNDIKHILRDQELQKFEDKNYIGVTTADQFDLRVISVKKLIKQQEKR